MEEHISCENNVYQREAQKTDSESLDLLRMILANQSI